MDQKTGWEEAWPLVYPLGLVLCALGTGDTYWGFFNINLFIYLFLAALGLRCCTRAFSSCGEQRLLFVTVAGFSLRCLLLLRSTGSGHASFSSCSTQAQ